MSTATWSIRRRLLVWLLAPMLLVWAAMLADSYLAARAAADRAYDRLLEASALAIAEGVVVANGVLDVDLPYAALDMLASSAQDRVFYRVSGPGDAFVTGYRDLPPRPEGAPASGSRRIDYYDARYRGEWVRVAALTQPIVGLRSGGEFQVQVAQTRGERDRLTRELVLAAALRLLALVVLAVAVMGFGIGRGLAPLNRLRQEVRNRSPQDLRPIVHAVPREVQDLVAAINHLMARLEASLAAMQRFIADASHQLRNPLAGLQAQVELALRERDPTALRQALKRLLVVTRRTSRLANQLLSLARANPESGEPALAPLDLTALARELTREAVPEALGRHLDLGFEGEGALAVNGNRLLLRELLKNLIDNALRYCPERSDITVRVAPAGEGNVLLEVEDDGPGIPLAERARVLERFYRMPGAPGDGCGLGLAIVKEIADRHDTVMTLASGATGRGLRVRLVFPGGAAITGVVPPEGREAAAGAAVDPL